MLRSVPRDSARHPGLLLRRLKVRLLRRVRVSEDGLLLLLVVAGSSRVRCTGLRLGGLRFHATFHLVHAGQVQCVVVCLQRKADLPSFDRVHHQLPFAGAAVLPLHFLKPLLADRLFRVVARTRWRYRGNLLRPKGLALDLLKAVLLLKLRLVLLLPRLCGIRRQLIRLRLTALQALHVWQLTAFLLRVGRRARLEETVHSCFQLLAEQVVRIAQSLVRIDQVDFRSRVASERVAGPRCLPAALIFPHVVRDVAEKLLGGVVLRRVLRGQRVARIGGGRVLAVVFDVELDLPHGGLVLRFPVLEFEFLLVAQPLLSLLLAGRLLLRVVGVLVARVRQVLRIRGLQALLPGLLRQQRRVSEPLRLVLEATDVVRDILVDLLVLVLDAFNEADHRPCLRAGLLSAHLLLELGRQLHLLLPLLLLLNVQNLLSLRLKLVLLRALRATVIRFPQCIAVQLLVPLRGLLEARRLFRQLGQVVDGFLVLGLQIVIEDPLDRDVVDDVLGVVLLLHGIVHILLRNHLVPHRIGAGARRAALVRGRVPEPRKRLRPQQVRLLRLQLQMRLQLRLLLRLLVVLLLQLLALNIDHQRCAIEVLDVDLLLELAHRSRFRALLRRLRNLFQVLRVEAGVVGRVLPLFLGIVPAEQELRIVQAGGNQVVAVAARVGGVRNEVHTLKGSQVISVRERLPLSDLAGEVGQRGRMVGGLHVGSLAAPLAVAQGRLLAHGVQVIVEGEAVLAVLALHGAVVGRGPAAREIVERRGALVGCFFGGQLARIRVHHDTWDVVLPERAIRRQGRVAARLDLRRVL